MDKKCAESRERTRSDLQKRLQKISLINKKSLMKKMVDGRKDPDKEDFNILKCRKAPEQEEVDR